MNAEDARGDERIEILLVEPNPGDTRLFTESFKDAKLTNNIFTVSDGESALDFVHQRGEYTDVPRPDLVLLEPQLPGTSGETVIAELEGDELLRDIPVVVLTASDNEEDIVKTHDVGADHYIQKPVEPEEFVEFIQSVEEFWLAIVQRTATSD